MRKIREILRLGFVMSLSCRQVARSAGVSRPTVAFYLDRFQQSGKSAQDLMALDDNELFSLVGSKESGRPVQQKPLPDWQEIHLEMGKKSVTLQLLWQEYIEKHPDGYKLSQFCELYRRWRKNLALSMRQTHKAGAKLFVDFAGQTIPVYDRFTGKIQQAQIFVAALGLSSYSYAEALPDQTLPNWIMPQVRAFEYFGGVTEAVVPDNPRTIIPRSCRYEPDINPSYQEMASHYGTAILPARVRHPKDKAKVESAVFVVERWILACLRNRKFFSYEELNQAIREKLLYLNNHPFKKLKGSRKEWFELFEKAALRPLPQIRYIFAEWKKVTANIDYHVDVAGHYYSVPYIHRGQELFARYTAGTVEIFLRGKRVASHLRDPRAGKHTTTDEHMPKSHREYLEWSPSRIMNWGSSIGPSTHALIEKILKSRPYPEQGYRSCLGVIRLGKRFSNERLERACTRALIIGAYNYTSVRSILERGLDAKMPEKTPSCTGAVHENIRGTGYYTERKEVALVTQSMQTPAVVPSA